MLTMGSHRVPTMSRHKVKLKRTANHQTSRRFVVSDVKIGALFLSSWHRMLHWRTHLQAKF